MNKLQTWVEKNWYAATPGGLKWLAPLEKLYLKLFNKNQQAYLSGKKTAVHLGVPVIVVGNINVGGSGKSPLVAALAKHFKNLGYQPGIVSRGYGGKAKHYPQRVTTYSNPQEVGDEPLMLAQQTQLPVAVDPNRAAAANLLVKEEGCDLIIADDGLQHLKLARDIEIVVVDAARGFGNGHCLPLGPLREPVERLNKVDWVIMQGEKIQEASQLNLKNTLHTYQLEFSGWRRGDGHWQKDCPFTAGQAVNAIAGIGNPQRFFNQLSQLGLKVKGYPLADHAQLTQEHLKFYEPKAGNKTPVVMTAKDAVKLQAWLNKNHWIAEVTASLPKEFLDKLQNQLADASKIHVN
ncbi:tetraacyldisaccharide 4'-kinase [Marinospirillum insulare]|uniref:Tetraacyldisaccharide 4'-kinase n=1 Tax=Marinospirillum insulare TaxID=217169 RepID=A0ABQ5ZZ70_9GAMM|nr:tetraacyldisaccharide 4'-kinase [Marinospirillum insulare]GLR64682.1 tetraacyldisaccharide 4'-kinase [Marinospirillum insulare]